MANSQDIPQWIAVEFEYAKRLRSAPKIKRPALYAEAYDAVTRVRWGTPDKIDDPEARTAGTSRALAEMIASLCYKSDRIIEFGAGRGLTAMVVARHVQHYVATDVAQPSLDETALLMRQSGITNVDVVRCSATDVDRTFSPGQFTKAISIDVVEHLHPDDAAEHYAHVCRALTTGGQYFICTPNILTGPHDCTRQVYPNAREPLGFHLNETSFTSLASALRRAGFSRCLSFSKNGFRSLTRERLTEASYDLIRHVPRLSGRARSMLSSIRIVAQK